MDKFIIAQLLMALLGSVGFSLRFHLRKTLILPAAIGGLLGWVVYLVCSNIFMQGIFISCLIASICVALYSEILARVLKAPATLFLIPGAVPLIPGSSLYYSMSYAVSGEWSVAKDYSIRMLEFALGIAIGISLVLAFFVMKERVKKQINE